MKYHFERFKKRFSQGNWISLTKSNSIGLTKSFYQDNNINKFKYANLFWDEANRAIAIHFTNKEGNGSFKVVKTKTSGAQIFAESFFKEIYVNPELYERRYKWKKCYLEDVGDIFVIKLKEKIYEPNSKKKTL